MATKKKWKFYTIIIWIVRYYMQLNMQPFLLTTYVCIMKNTLCEASKPTMLKNGESLVRFNLSDLSYIEADRVYCTLHMCDGVTHHQLSNPLGKIEEKLPKEDFVRVSRSLIVNLKHISKKTGNMLFLDGATGPIVMAGSHKSVLDKSFNIFSLTGQK